MMVTEHERSSGATTATAFVVSSSHHEGLALATLLTQHGWIPQVLDGWTHAVALTIAHAAAVVTDTAALSSPKADLVLLGIVAPTVPILAIGRAADVPTWAQHRVSLVPHWTDIPPVIERFRP